jgi:iron complex outermembrane receptor protein
MLERNITKKKYDFCFSRWSRRSYAVFNSLHKVVKIGVLSCTCGFLSLYSPSLFSQNAAQTDSSFAREITLDEVIIGESRASIFIAPQQITAVINRKEIEQAGVETLQDLLSYVQGIDLRTRGNNGIQADVSLRGGTFDQAMVLLNGINLTDPQTGHFLLNIPINLEAVERIEVLEGMGSMAYNTVAYSGCVNIITRTPEDNVFDLSLRAGMYGTIHASANSHFRLKKWYFTIGGSLNRSEGFTQNTDFAHGNLFLRTLYKDKKKGIFDLQGGFQAKEYGAHSFYSARYNEQYEQIRVFFGSANYLWLLQRWKTGINAYVRGHYDQFRLFRNEAPAWYGGHNYHRTLLGGVNLQTAYNYGWGNTALGIDFKEEHLISNNLGDPLPYPVPVYPHNNSIFYDKGKQREHIGFQVQQNFKSKGFKTSVGVRGNWCRDYGFNWNIGTNGVVFLPSKVELNYFVQSVYRLPTFTDLYYSSVNQTGNPNLQPEQAIVGEIGAEWKPRQWKIGITGFYRYGFKIIDWVRLSLDDNWFCENRTHIQATGADFSISFTPKKGYVSQIGMQYNYLYVAKNSQGYLSLYATDYLRNQVKISIHHRIFWKLYAHWQFNFQDRAGTYLDFSSQTEKRYKPYMLCNAKINLQLKNAQVFVEATNLFNTPYFDLGNIPQPRIWIKGGITVTL